MNTKLDKNIYMANKFRKKYLLFFCIATVKVWLSYEEPKEKVREN